MDYSAKTFLITWWILALIALFLWYRNMMYDRILAVLVFIFGISQLIEYGARSGINTNQAGQALFIILWLECLVLAIGVFIYTKTVLSLIIMLLFAVVFVSALLYALFGASFTGTFDKNNIVTWHRDETTLLGGWEWLYCFGIIMPLLVLLLFYGWSNIGPILLVIYVIIAGCLLFVLDLSPSTASYILVGFAFLAWMIGVQHSN